MKTLIIALALLAGAPAYAGPDCDALERELVRVQAALAGRARVAPATSAEHMAEHVKDMGERRAAALAQSIVSRGEEPACARELEEARKMQ